MGNERSCVIRVSLCTGVYRHIRISERATLFQLHQAIIDAFGFDDDHAHAFLWTISPTVQATPIPRSTQASPRGAQRTAPPEKPVSACRKKFKYVFDFEDDWVFQCRVLKIINEQTEKPVILRKKGEIPEQYPYFPDDFESAETATVILDQEADGAIVCVDLPEIYSKTKLKKAYRALGLPEPKVDLLHSCFDAAANFYGIIPLQTLFTLYNAQNAPLPRDRFAAFAEAARHEQHNYRIIGTGDFLRVKCGAAPEAAECFLLCICAVMTTGLASPNTIVTALRSKGLQISSGAAQVHAEQLLSDIYLHMPVYLYRGHPPLEAETLLESES